MDNNMKKDVHCFLQDLQREKKKQGNRGSHCMSILRSAYVSRSGKDERLRGEERKTGRRDPEMA